MKTEPQRPYVPKGKIGRLPFTVREELNLRLRDNQGGPEILAWLNDSQKLSGSEAITPQNLSEWRAGGWARWLEKQDEVVRIEKLAEMARRMATAAGGNLSEGAAAILGGQILEALETVDDEDRIKLGQLLVSLRSTDLEARKTGLKEEEVALKRRAQSLDEAKFQRTTAELFLKWFANEEARRIVTSGATNSEKIEQLGLAMFGEDWKQ